MGVVQQIYCTHCTLGTSALDRRQGEAALATAGWAPRAGSLKGDELRKGYDQIRACEVFTSYTLPRDHKRGEDNLRLTAADAPRRLAYYPCYPPPHGLLRGLGLVCHRQLDASKERRFGEIYFSHVLFSQSNEQSWSVLECLKLWGAPWVVEDSPEIPHELAPLGTIADLLADRPPAIDDRVLEGFLTTPPPGDFYDPQHVIPDRWKHRSVDDRQSLLRDLAQAYLGQCHANKQDGVLLVAEPSLAALLFYGLCRLLPAGPLRDQISFSTYEPEPRRLNVLLAATTFLYPEQTDLHDGAYRWARFTYNTFTGRASERRPTQSHYATVVFDLLCTEGAAAVARLQQEFLAAGAEKYEDLELLGKARGLVPALLEPEAPLPEQPWSQSKPVRVWLGQSLRRQWAGSAGDSARLEPLAGVPRQLLLLELAATEHASAVGEKAVAQLLRLLPPTFLPQLLASEHVALRYKVEAVFQYVEQHRPLPDDCAALWEEPAPAAGPAADPSRRLLPVVLTCLNPALVGEVLQQLWATPRRTLFLAALTWAARTDSAKQDMVRWAIENLDADPLWDLLARPDLPAGYPWPRETLSPRLGELLDSLPWSGPCLEKRLQVLRRWADFFPNLDTATNCFEAWDRLLAALRDTQPEGKQGGQRPGRGRADYNQIGKTLADQMPLLMPLKSPPDVPQGTEKQRCLRAIGEGVLNTPDFLPDYVWLSIETYYVSQHNDGNLAVWRLLKPSRIPASWKSAAKRLSWKSVAAAVALLLLLAGGLWAYTHFGRSRETASTTIENEEPKPKPRDELPKGKDKAPEGTPEKPEKPAEEPLKGKDKPPKDTPEKPAKEEPAPAVYVLTVDPPEAEVTVTGKGASIQGTGATRTITIPQPHEEGKVLVKATLPGYQPLERQIQPKAGESGRLAMQLEPPPRKPGELVGIATHFVDLPFLGGKADSSGEQILWQFAPPVPEYRVHVHGLKGEPGRKVRPLKAERAPNNPRAVRVIHEGTGGAFIEFSVNNGAVKYALNPEAPEYEAREWLADCVLELKPPQGPSQFIALRKRVFFLHRLELPKKQGWATLDENFFNKMDAPFSSYALLNYDLYLGEGAIHLLSDSTNAKRYEFGQGVQEQRGHLVTGLADRFQKCEVQVTLERVTSGNGKSCQQLRLEFPKLDSEAVQKHKEKRSQLVGQSAEYDSQIRGFAAALGRVRSEFDRNRSGKSIFGQLRVVSDATGRAIPVAPTPPDPRHPAFSKQMLDRYDDDQRMYQNEKREFLKAGDKYLEDLRGKKDRVDLEKKDEDDSLRKLEGPSKAILETADAVSAVLYRVVDGIRVDVIKIGEPPVSEPKPATAPPPAKQQQSANPPAAASQKEF